MHNNLAPGSFDSRRECAIEVRDADVLDRLHEVAHADWQNSHPLDLTDEGGSGLTVIYGVAGPVKPPRVGLAKSY